MKNKEFYDLSELSIRWDNFGAKIRNLRIFENGNLIYQRLLAAGEFGCDVYNTWLESEHEILTKEEKEYLSFVIKPFRKRVKSLVICKDNSADFLRLVMKCYSNTDFPLFEAGRYYKGMEENREYTLEELGL